MPDYVRPMRHEDIRRVLEIDREAFPTEWPPPNLKRELENRMAHYIVACRADELIDPGQHTTPAEAGRAGLGRWLRSLFGRGPRPAGSLQAKGNECITGFAGFWVMADEAHITSIASGERYRGQGIGELLLQSLIEDSVRLHARIVTLEVRVSNTAAQRLYTKYGFSQVGLRRGYYTDNREDAIIMSTQHLTSAGYGELLGRLKARYREKWGPERYGMGASAPHVPDADSRRDPP